MVTLGDRPHHTLAVCHLLLALPGGLSPAGAVAFLASLHGLVSQVAGELLRSLGARAPHHLGRSELRQVNALRRAGHNFPPALGADTHPVGLDRVKSQARGASQRFSLLTSPQMLTCQRRGPLGEGLTRPVGRNPVAARMAKVEPSMKCWKRNFNRRLTVRNNR